MAVDTLPDLPYGAGAGDDRRDPAAAPLPPPRRLRQGANDTLDQLAEAAEGAGPAVTVGLEKTLAFNLSGHVLHSIFWRNLSPDGGGRPDGELAAAISEHFGSIEAFSKRLSAATTAVQGSGWGVLGYEPLSGRLIIEQLYDHHGNVGVGSTPLLVFDAWEHAYYLQYRNVRPDYVARLWDLVSWADVAARFAEARAGRQPLPAG